MEALLSNISELLPHFPEKPHVLVLDHPPVQWKESHPEVERRSTRTMFISAFIALGVFSTLHSWLELCCNFCRWSRSIKKYFRALC